MYNSIYQIIRTNKASSCNSVRRGLRNNIFGHIDSRDDDGLSFSVFCSATYKGNASSLDIRFLKPIKQKR